MKIGTMNLIEFLFDYNGRKCTITNLKRIHKVFEVLGDFDKKIINGIVAAVKKENKNPDMEFNLVFKSQNFSSYLMPYNKYYNVKNTQDIIEEKIIYLFDKKGVEPGYITEKKYMNERRIIKDSYDHKISKVDNENMNIAVIKRVNNGKEIYSVIIFLPLSDETIHRIADNMKELQDIEKTTSSKPNLIVS